MRTHSTITQKQLEAANKTAITEISKPKLFTLITRMNTKAVEKGVDKTYPLGFSQVYFKKIGKGGDYDEQFRKMAIEAGIIMCDKKQETGKAYCYWQNQEHLDSPLVKVPLMKESDIKKTKDEIIELKTSWSYSELSESLIPSSLNPLLNALSVDSSNRLFDKYHRIAFRRENVINNLAALKVDEAKIMSGAEEWLKEISKKLTFFCYDKSEAFKKLTVFSGEADEKLTAFCIDVDGKKEKVTRGDNSDLPKKVDILFRNTGRTVNSFTASTVMEAHQNGKVLIRYERDFYVDDLENFIRLKRKFMMQYVEGCLVNMRSTDTMYAGRNLTNSRLDHNLTSAPEFMVDIIMEDNGLIEIDWSNSQFAIHAYQLMRAGWMEKYDDVKKYYEMCCSKGSLYEDMTRHLNLNKDCRAEVKGMMMSFAFAGKSPSDNISKVFQSDFKMVTKSIKLFKSVQKKKKSAEGLKFGTEMFSIDKAEMEAQIVIDNILPSIHATGLFCLTKHDSVIVRKEDKEIALKIIKEFLNHIKFECRLKAAEDYIYIKNEKKAVIIEIVKSKYSITDLDAEFYTKPSTRCVEISYTNGIIPTRYQDLAVAVVETTAIENEADIEDLNKILSLKLKPKTEPAGVQPKPAPAAPEPVTIGRNGQPFVYKNPYAFR